MVAARSTIRLSVVQQQAAFAALFWPKVKLGSANLQIQTHTYTENLSLSLCVCVLACISVRARFTPAAYC